MLKFGVPKEEVYDNPTTHEMKVDFAKVIDAAKIGKIRKAKMAMARDKEKNIVKLVVVFDSKEYDAAFSFLYTHECDLEPLHPVGDVNKLLKMIKKIIKTAEETNMVEEVKEAVENNVVVEETKEETGMMVEETKVTEEVMVAAYEEVVEAVKVEAPVEEESPLEEETPVEETSDAPVTEEAPVEEPVNSDEESALEEAESDENSVSEQGRKGMRVKCLRSNLNTMDILDNQIGLSPKERMKLELERQYAGTKFISPSEVKIVDDDDNRAYLTMHLKKDKKTGGKVYHIDEIIDGEAQCQNNIKADFPASVLKKAGVALEDFIINRQGDYSNKINVILSIMKCIAENCLLEVDSRKCINHELFSNKEFMERLKEFLLNNPLDERVGYINTKRTVLLGIVGRGNYTAYQNFKRLVAELAPENDAKRMKDNLFAGDYFITDPNAICKDSQKTIGREAIIANGIRGDKMYAFKFDEEFIEEFQTEYAKCVAAQELDKEGGK